MIYSDGGRRFFDPPYTNWTRGVQVLRQAYYAGRDEYAEYTWRCLEVAARESMEEP